MLRLYLTALVWLCVIVSAGACASAQGGTQDVLTLEVAPHTVDCTGEGPQRCLLVREVGKDEWTRFYDPIAGFEHEPGYGYRLRVERRRVENPPADGSSFEYRLLEVLSRERSAEG